MPIQLSGSGSITGVSTLTSLASLDVTGSVSVGGTLIYDDVTNIDSLGIVTARSDVHIGAGLSVTGISTFNDYLDINGDINIDGSQITYTSSSNQLKFADDAQLRFGGDNDLRIYHSSSSNFISASPNFKLLTDTFRLNNAANNNNIIVADSGDGVDLYFNNSKKFETTNTGATVTGELECDSLDVDGIANIQSVLTVQSYIQGTTTLDLYGDSSASQGLSLDASGNVTLQANLDLQDNDKILLGNGDDLDMYHDGTDSYIRNNTGQLLIRGNDIKLNNYLGTQTHAEFADGGLTTGAIDLSAISSSISDTAVDVFVYDTRKDSDGGAWRKRTQHTSWYNETLNTSTRGSRKEFPAVAVIVAESNQVTIYDGDDPDLPMWMVFNQGGSYVASNNLIGSTSGTNSAISSLNGILSLTTGNEALYLIKFISDTSQRITNSADREYLGGIGERNSGKGLSPSNSTNYIVNANCNDVAMTVLPNAPIDETTGLPVPTIAVATDGGISIIKDDVPSYHPNNETIVDMVPNDTGERPATEIGFTESNKIVFKHQYNWVYYYEIPSSDLSGSYWNALDGYIGRFTSPDRDWDTNFKGIPVHAPSNTDITTFVEDRALGHGNGLNIIDINKDGLLGYGMQAAISTDFNTGYQHGDIKGAFLSDTDATNLVDTNLVSNGTFDTDTSGWSSSGSITVTHDSGRLKMVSGSGNPFVYTAVTCVVGKRYYVQLDVQGEVSFHAGPNASSSGDVAYIPYGSYGSSTTRHCFFVATATTMYLVPHVIGTGNTGYIDNVICKLADHDRSVYGSAKKTVGGVDGISNGLATYGTITKSAVATGADLVAYSGFSASNYLQQPVNSEFEFGTGDWAFYGWYSDPVGSSGTRTIFEIGRSTVSGDHIGMRHDGSNLELFISDDSFGSQDVAEYAETPTGEWRFACGLRRGNQIEIYSNGVLKATTNIANATNDLGDNQSYLRFGNRTYVTQPWDGSLALWRASKSAPSPEQIKKIYNDEKHLFHENAKCTLYGSSDAVTALAYDEDTELLHVGTSSGRSDFQGLRRINNTTTAVTTAISASDDLIAEQ